MSTSNGTSKRAEHHGAVPPSNLRAEESILGAMLLDARAVDEALGLLTADDFYRPTHGHIFAAIARLHASGEPVDALTVATELERKGLLAEVGGRAALLDFQAAVPAISNAASYAGFVADDAERRRYLRLARDLHEIVHSGADIETTRNEVEQATMAALATSRGLPGQSQGLRRIGDLLPELLDDLEARAERGTHLVGCTTGLADLDHAIGGLENGTMVILGARPAMGKTLCAMGFARAAAGAGYEPLVFSKEMRALELARRALSSESLVDFGNLRTGVMEDPEWDRVSDGVGRLAGIPLWIDDTASITVAQIRTRARQHLAVNAGARIVIIVDYLQLFDGDGESRQAEVAKVSRELALLSRELMCPVVVLCQLNRGLESRADKRPVLSDLRDSGQIEQDADVVLFLYRDEVYDDASPDKGVAEIIIAKQRNGPTGRVRVAYRGRYQRFDNMARAVA